MQRRGRHCHCEKGLLGFNLWFQKVDKSEKTRRQGGVCEILVYDKDVLTLGEDRIGSSRQKCLERGQIEGVCASKITKLIVSL